MSDRYMTQYTLVQIHFVRGLINHRLRFGSPDSLTKIDKFRSIAAFSEGSIFGYIRWGANQYGTQDWRVYVVKVSNQGFNTVVQGITPAVKIMVFAQGKLAVKRCLSALDELEIQIGGALENVPESYWAGFNNALLLRRTPRKLPRHIRVSELSHAR